MRDHEVDLVGIGVPAHPAVAAAVIHLEYLRGRGFERGLRLLRELGLDPLFDPGVFGERRARRHGQHVRGGLEDEGEVEEDAEREMLGVLAGLAAIRVPLGRDGDAEPVGDIEKEPEPVRVAELGDPMQVSDQPFGVGLLWPGEEVLDHRARRGGIAVEDAQVQG